MEEKVQHATLQKHSQQRAPLIGNTVNQRAISPCWHCQKTLLDRPLKSVLAEGRDFFPKFVTLFIHGFSGEFLNIAVVSFLLSPTRKGDPNLSPFSSVDDGSRDAAAQEERWRSWGMSVTC